MLSLARLFGQVLLNIMPDLQKTPSRDRKIVAVGLARLLTQSQRMVAEPCIRQWYVFIHSPISIVE